jgi:hypothetical protein
MAHKTDGEVRDDAMRVAKPLVRSRMQDYHAGSIYYDMELMPGEPTFRAIFHQVWKIFFTPSPAVRGRLENAMSEMGLAPFKYTAAHCRVLYAMDNRPEWIQQSWAENALNCASELRPKTTIFFTSDSPKATYYAQQYAKQRNATIATRVPNPNPPLHIDFGWRRRPVSDFYDAFVDLYILAQADCVTYNKGGYGLFGSLIGRNASCSLRQDAINRPKIENPCHWTTGDENNTAIHEGVGNYQASGYVPIYFEPMKPIAFSQ